MSSSVLVGKKQTRFNPLDEVEEFMAAQEWSYHRAGFDELLVEVPGRWCDYHVSFFWQEEVNVLQLFVSLDIQISHARTDEAIRLMGLINQRLAFGHFELAEENLTPAYRYAYLLTGQSAIRSIFLEELIDFSLGECERFYPAFQFTILGDKSAAEAVEIALLDTLGEA
ncbi:MAG: YbjN domain-containing protein [Alphaproteobacteria bacterium]|nr:YbjN domain-containing protein [Alphaproteobacteria bacterium]